MSLFLCLGSFFSDYCTVNDFVIIICNVTLNLCYFRDSPSRSISISPVKRKNSASTSEASLLKVSQKDEDLFFKAQQKVRSRIEENTKWMRAQGDNGVFPPKIRIGKFEIQSLYSSPYPEEFAALPLLYICEKCLMYMCNDARHQVIVFFVTVSISLFFIVIIFFSDEMSNEVSTWKRDLSQRQHLHLRS